MRDEVNAFSVGHWGRSNLALGVDCGFTKNPVHLSRIHRSPEPFILTRPKDGQIVDLGEAGRRSAGLQLPAQLAASGFESINITAARGLTSAVSGDKDQIVRYQRIAMEAARAAIGPRIVRPDFFPRILVQRIELAGAGSDEEQLSTDRGLGKNSASRLNLPHNLPTARIPLSCCHAR